MRALLVVLLADSCDASWFGRGRGGGDALPTIVTPTIVGASHNVPGYGPECAADENEETYWLVPGGQRMEMMSRDKWLVLDLGAERTVDAISLLGIVDSFSKARMMLDVAESPDGPWERVGSFRALGTPLRWQKIDLGAVGDGPQRARFFRLLVRREGHATFRHRVHGITVHTAPEAAEGEAA